MTIHLPEDLENSIHSEVLSGRFSTVEDALAAAWRAHLDQPHRQKIGPKTSESGQGEHDGDGTRQTVAPLHENGDRESSDDCLGEQEGVSRRAEFVSRHPDPGAGSSSW